MKRLGLALKILFALIASTAMAAPPQAQLSESPRLSAAQELQCPSRCEANFSKVFHSQSGRCAAWFTIPCYPARCDQKSGLCSSQQCVSSGDCSPGAVCNNRGVCVPISYQCANDTTLMNPDGAMEDCSPNRCQAGACRQSCSSNADCASGAHCTAGRCLK